MTVEDAAAKQNGWTTTADRGDLLSVIRLAESGKANSKTLSTKIERLANTETGTYPRAD